jgi:hypothetical protein
VFSAHALGSCARLARCAESMSRERERERRWPRCGHARGGILPRSNGVCRVMRAGRPFSTSHGGNVRAERPTKTPEGQRRHTVLRYARPPPLRRLFWPFSSLCSFLPKRIKVKLGFKGGGRATLPAFGRRLRHDGVRGYAPQINRRVGASFCSLGRQNLFGSPRLFSAHFG